MFKRKKQQIPYTISPLWKIALPCFLWPRKKKSQWSPSKICSYPPCPYVHSCTHQNCFYKLVYSVPCVNSRPGSQGPQQKWVRISPSHLHRALSATPPTIWSCPFHVKIFIYIYIYICCTLFFLKRHSAAVAVPYCSTLVSALSEWAT